jgi:hypothetical protein
LNNHVASVHEDKILFNWEGCNIEFAKKSSLIRHTSNVHTEKFQENKIVEEATDIKTEYGVELKQENISNGNLNTQPAVQIKTEMETESVQNEDLILGV